MGKGRVVLYAFNPLHRYLNHADFRWVYNAVLNWNDLAISFYKQIGAKLMNEWSTFRLTGDALARVAEDQR